MAEKYQHEDVAAVPSGWKVRTVTAGVHKIRVAFPPGKRVKGSGRLISVLHPRGENPLCNAMRNPAELVLMGANPLDAFDKKHLDAWLKNNVSASDRRHAGKLIRQYVKAHPEVTTEVPSKSWDDILRYARSEYGNPSRRLNPMFNANFSDDEKLALGRLGIKWTAIQSAADVRRARKALKEAARIRRRFGNPSLPMEEQRERAREIYTGFHAAPPENKIVMDEGHIPAGAYPELGLLISVGFKPTPKAAEPYEKNFISEKENVHVIGSLTRDQIYFAGGDQTMSERDLRYFGWQGEKEFHLGTAVRIVYLAKKYHQAVPEAGRGELVEWIHELGEETGEKPTFWYDTELKRIFFKHGAYEIRNEGIVN